MNMDRLVVLLALGGIVLFTLLPTIVVLLTPEQPPIETPPPSTDRGERSPGPGRPAAGR
jgi:hypothetical protein